ncbi:MAG: ABC transporter permease [Thermoplasmata archaeon]|nr:ABC transporter permease [Thermoplasmata archaeon]
MAENIKVYVPDNSIKKGYRSLFREMAEEVRTSKWLTWQLFKRDFKIIYQQSVLGILWILIPPMMTVGTFIFLNDAGIFNVGDISVPYPLFALLGVALWQVFATGLNSTTNSLMAAGSMISKINFPREALVFSSMGKVLITFLIQMGLVVVLFVYYGIVPPWTVILFPFTLIPVLLLALGLGLILSILNGVVRDVGRTLPIITTFLMFLTPILYATPQSGFLATLTEYNPLYYLLIVPRDLILIGETSLWDGYLISSLLSIGAFFACWIIFHLTETRIAERI